MTRVPFVDLQAQHAALEPQLSIAVAEVMRSCDFILGRAVQAFEAEFAAFTGARHAIGVSSGLAALQLSLQAAGVGTGDEVILPTNTFIATALATTAVGGKPVLVDVDEATFNLDPVAVQKAITRRTKAIIPVHLYGQPCEMDALRQCAQAHGLVVIEDACQAHGARYRQRATGTFGLTGCFSFYPAKNLGAGGDGGMIVTDNDEVAEKLRVLRDCGRRGKYYHVLKGTNARLDTLQAAILRVKLPHLSRWNELRACRASRYTELLDSVSAVKTPSIAPDRTHVFHLYVVRVQRRAELQQYLVDRGIQTAVHYPLPIHRQEAYADLGCRAGDFPVAESLAGEILSLPIFPELTDEQIEHVCLGIRSFYSV